MSSEKSLWMDRCKRHQMRLNVGGELGYLTGARFVIQNSLKTFCRKAAQQVAHRDGMEASRFRNAFAGACLSLALVGQEQHPRTGQSAGGSSADAGAVISTTFRLAAASTARVTASGRLPSSSNKTSVFSPDLSQHSGRYRPLIATFSG